MATFNITGFTNYDDWMTPSSVWTAIKQYIPPDKLIWESFYGNGESGTYLESMGFNVIHQDIDFFYNNLGEIIISNPPFALKKEVFKRLKEINKPFIMICPCSMITTQYFKKLFEDEGIQIIIPNKRIQFLKLVDGEIDTSKNQCNFDCFYYCYKMNLEKDIIFLKE